MSASPCPFCGGHDFDEPLAVAEGCTRICLGCGAIAEREVVRDRTSPVTKLTATHAIWRWKNPNPPVISGTPKKRRRRRKAS